MSDDRQEAWKRKDRTCQPCPYCGTPLFEAFFGGGGWAPLEIAEPKMAHDNTRCRNACKTKFEVLEAWARRAYTKLNEHSGEHPGFVAICEGFPLKSELQP
jgi:hypothetical protein